ncbi:MAG TPA: alpha/beta fold hydrolase [Woeseiaceae bacterium]|nr:alpha/beta fold hydrolase [Woeseiaceae bacterium]
MSEPENRSVTAADGYRLATTFYQAGNTDTVVLINSATAVPRRFYQRFARYIQHHGWHVLTYDYRGIGESRPQSLRGFEARMRDWALLDMTAMVEWITSEIAPRRMFVVGHSFGGQTVGMLENAERLHAVVGVSAQSGHWAVQGGKEPVRVRIIVTVLIPLIARLFGYFPWSRFARGEDLPKNVALEWAAWCRNRNYLLDDPTLPLDRYKSFAAPILAYSIEDDDWGTSRAVDEMMRAYVNVTRRHLRPEDYGLSRLQHMGYFREGSEPLWQEAIEWLDEVVPRQARGDASRLSGTGGDR